MRIEQLEYLCEVAKRRSMNVAAEKLHIAQQTLSTSIKTLEKELDVKLLERTYQGVFPTPIGQEVISWAEQVLSGLDYLKLKIEAEKETRLTGTLQVATDHGINLLIMPKVVSHFHKFHPADRSADRGDDAAGDRGGCAGEAGGYRADRSL